MSKQRIKQDEIEYNAVVDVLCELFNRSYADKDWKECRMCLTKIWDLVSKEKGDSEANRVINPFAKKLRKAE